MDGLGWMDLLILNIWNITLGRIMGRDSRKGAAHSNAHILSSRPHCDIPKLLSVFHVVQTLRHLIAPISQQKLLLNCNSVIL